MGHYTFKKAIAIFVILTILYFIRKTYSKKSIASKILSFLKNNNENFVYGAFILYFIAFFITFVFKVSDIFTYATYAMIMIYAFFKILGFKIDYTLPKTKLNNSVFLRLLLISMSVMLVMTHYILSAYEVSVSTKLIYGVVAIVYLVLFIFFF